MWSPNVLNDEVLNSVPLLDDRLAVMLPGRYELLIISDTNSDNTWRG